MMRYYLVILGASLFALGLATAAQAEAPIIDLNDLPAHAAAPPTEGPAASVSEAATDLQQPVPNQQRLQLLEQQMNNLMQMNLPGKLDELEQQVQQLNGQLEEQAHAVQLLQASSTLIAEKAVESDNKEDGEANVVATSLTAANLPESKPRLSSATQPSPLAPIPAVINAKPVATNPIDAAQTAVVQNKPVKAAVAAEMDNGAPIGNVNAEEQAYQTAFDLMLKKQNVAALAAFQAFLKSYPNHLTYAPNAHYWLGELYSADNKNTAASKEFTTIVQKYPQHAKVADAMLKLAIIHDEAGQHAQAKTELLKVAQQFPYSGAAKLANMRLQSLP